jgi:hypothetical protein
MDVITSLDSPIKEHLGVYLYGISRVRLQCLFYPRPTTTLQLNTVTELLQTFMIYIYFHGEPITG